MNYKLRTMNSRKRGFTVAEGIILFASVAIVTYVGAAAHRWLWAQAELLSYRSTMQSLTNIVRAMPSKAVSKHMTFQLQVDPSRGIFRLTSTGEKAIPYETVERTLWLPRGLQVSEAPDVLSAKPSGKLSSASILILAPSFNKIFRVTTSETGSVHLDEESAL